ncbi:Cytochrome [Forsythia ovata]|uniref:Cytochrome n=1 Tax=Forsythia ovata TaxID=205694 RepID=A0ABD1TQ19_9LAMI
MQNGPCFQPNTVKDHFNYAVNSYYQKKGQIPQSCNLLNTATVTQSAPTYLNRKSSPTRHILHRSLQALSKCYDPLMMIPLGRVPAVIISFADAAHEIMKNQDVIFSNRPKLSIIDKIIYDSKDIAFAPYGEYWRQKPSLPPSRIYRILYKISPSTITDPERSLEIVDYDIDGDSCYCTLLLKCQLCRWCRTIIVTAATPTITSANFGDSFIEECHFLKLNADADDSNPAATSTSEPLTVVEAPPRSKYPCPFPPILEEPTCDDPKDAAGQ